MTTKPQSNSNIDVADFVADPENIKKAVEGSMDKRLKVLDNSNIDKLMEMLDVNKISSAHDLYSGKPAPYAEGYSNGFNTAKSMLKQAIQQELLKARKDELDNLLEWYDNLVPVDGRLLKRLDDRLDGLQAKLKDTTRESE